MQFEIKLARMLDLALLRIYWLRFSSVFILSALYFTITTISKQSSKILIVVSGQRIKVEQLQKK